MCIVPAHALKKAENIVLVSSLRLLIALGVYMNRKDIACWPSRDTLKARAGIASNDTFYKARKELMRLDLIRTERRRVEGKGSHFQVVYSWV